MTLAVRAILSAVCALTLLFVFLPDLTKAGDDSFDIALSLDISGKGGWNTCNTFAKELYRRISEAGGEAHYIVYDWVDDQNFSGRHAFVVYRDSSGRYWGIDQMCAQPKWLVGSNPKKWAYWFAAPREAHIVYSQTEPMLAGRYPDRSRPENAQLAGQIAAIPDPLPLNRYVAGMPNVAGTEIGDPAVFERSLVQRTLFRSSFSLVLR
jgi:hypothetical protein